MLVFMRASAGKADLCCLNLDKRMGSRLVTASAVPALSDFHWGHKVQVRMERRSVPCDG